MVPTLIAEADHSENAPPISESGSGAYIFDEKEKYLDYGMSRFKGRQ